MSPKWDSSRGWGTRTMNNTVYTLEIANARSAELIEQARRHGLAKRARRTQDISPDKVHTVHAVSRSGERSMT